MADETVTLPNVDIFDPIMCAKRWAQCATQQEINVYLNKQIDINRTVLTDTINSQNKINAVSKETLADHETRIKSLETGLSDLNKAQSDLNAAFQTLQTDNNNFKSNVDLLLNQYQTTINLLQSNIDKITTSNEELWAEVNKLKSQFDPDKLDAAIAGYDGVLASCKAYTDEQIKALTAIVDANKAAFDSWVLDHDSDFQAYKISMSNKLNEIQGTWNTNLLTMQGQMDALVKSSNLQFDNFDAKYTKEIARLDSLIVGINGEIKDINTAISDGTTDRAAIRSEMESLHKTITGETAEQISGVNKTIDSLAATVSDNKTELENEIQKNSDDISELNASDSKQWDTINQVLTMQNTLVAKGDALQDSVNEQIKLVNVSVDANKSDIEKQATEITAINKQLSLIDLNAGKGQIIATFNGDDPIIAASTVSLDGINITTAKTSAAAYNNVTLAVTADAGIGGVYVVPAVEYGRPQSLPMNSTVTNPNNTNSNRIEMEFFKAGWQVNAKLAVFYNASTKLVQFVYYPPIEENNTGN